MATHKELAYKMIPVLVRWARTAWYIPHYYSDLSKAVGYNSNQIGNILGTIHDILNKLAKEEGWDIPTLNALVINKTQKVPSNGLQYVIPDYDNTKCNIREDVQLLNYKAHLFDWSKVLKKLGLEEAIIYNEEEQKTALGSIHHGFGGEGIEHKKIKEFILHYPEKIGIKNINYIEQEKQLLSGDRIDVYFECRRNKRIAIEVKPSTSPDEDILRGIYQCIKYKAVMEAEQSFYGKPFEVRTILVTSNIISRKNKQIAMDLGIEYLEDFLVKKMLPED